MLPDLERKKKYYKMGQREFLWRTYRDEIRLRFTEIAYNHESKSFTIVLYNRNNIMCRPPVNIAGTRSIFFRRFTFYFKPDGTITVALKY